MPSFSAYEFNTQSQYQLQQARSREISLKDFSGGLNNFWDPSSIGQTEVPYLINMEFTPTGALTSRPAVVESTLPAIPTQYVSGSSGPKHNIEILGYFNATDEVRWLVAAVGTKTYILNIDDATPTWTEIWDHRATGFVQYAYEIVLCKATTGGLRYNPATSTATVIATMPALDGLVIFRERFFGWGVADTTKNTEMHWSDLTAIGTGSSVWDWNIDSVTQVGYGDGSGISRIVPDYSNLWIFKDGSTYSYTFSDLPEEGTLSLVQKGIGAENKYCVTPYQNGYVVFDDTTVYKFLNGQFTPLNAQKIRFKDANLPEDTDLLFPHAVSIFGDRAIVFFYGSLYVLNLLTGTWSQWQSVTNVAYFAQTPPGPNHLQYDWAFVATADTSLTAPKLYRIEDQPVASTGSETFTCHMRTRIYDFETPAEWKRLYWWAIDLAADGDVTATVTAIAASATARSWDQISTTTWDVLDTRTWDRILSEDAYVTTVRTLNEGVPQRSLLKLEHSIRFRRAYFEVYFTCDGTAETSPAQIFSITPMVGVKAKMTKGVA